MTPRKFFKETVNLYHKARIPKYRHKRIFRGESSSIASETEDLFACYLIGCLPRETMIFINQTITTGTGEERLRIKPDLIITQNRIITAILDLKMDLGYKRNEFPDYWRQRDDLILSLRGKEFSLFIKSGAYRKKRAVLNFASDAKLLFVLVSDQNINPKLLTPVLEMKGKMPNSDLFILSHKIHPNQYEMSVDDVIRKIDIDEQEFVGVVNSICKIKKPHKSFQPTARNAAAHFNR
jgi:hypothetical protein